MPLRLQLHPCIPPSFCTKLQEEAKKALFRMCTKNPTEGGKASYIDTKASVIFKLIFCNFVC